MKTMRASYITNRYKNVWEQRTSRLRDFTEPPVLRLVAKQLHVTQRQAHVTTLRVFLLFLNRKLFGYFYREFPEAAFDLSSER